MKSLFGRIRQAVAQAIYSFSITSKVIFTIFICVCLASGLYMLNSWNQRFLIEVPKRSDSISIGIIGTPRVINPVLAETESSKNLVALVFSGLLKKDTLGNIVPDLAESYTRSENNKSITFKLRNNIFFHDNTPITTTDIAFTISKIQDPTTKSPYRAYWENIRITTQSETEITFTSDKVFSSNLKEMTIGVLPAHIWKTIPHDQFGTSEYNTEPIGSGPYYIDSVTRGRGGLASGYVLKAFNKYYPRKAYIKTIDVNIFQNETEAIRSLRSGMIEELGALPPSITPELIYEGKELRSSSLPRVFALFFNQNQNTILKDSAVRNALNISAPRQEIVAQIFHGYATPLFSPLPPFMYEVNPSVLASSSIETAEKILDKAGWIRGEDGLRSKKGTGEPVRLALSIATSDVPDLKNTAEILKETWKKIGVDVTVDIYESSDLNQNVIRERKYDSLLFGQVIPQGSDLYAFWHSSQRKDPGLNVAIYTNPQVDKLLESMRVSTSTDLSHLYKPFQVEFDKDIPAVFLYSPLYIEAVPNGIKGYSTTTLLDPSERFLNSSEWYVRTEKIWPIFKNF